MTKLSDVDMHRRINRIREAAKSTAHRLHPATSSEDEDEAADESLDTKKRRIATIEGHFIDELFSNSRQSNLIKTRHDYLLSDLLKIPSGSMSRRMQPINIPIAVRTDLRSALILRNMKTVRQPDHTNFYLIPGQHEVADEAPLPVEQPAHLDQPEDQRGRDSMIEQISGIHSIYTTSNIATTETRKSKRASARLAASTAQESISLQTPFGEAHLLQQSDQMFMMPPEQIDVQPQQLQFDETMQEQPPFPIPPETTDVSTIHVEVKEPRGLYEKIVLDEISAARAKNEPAVLQNIIHQADLTQKCMTSSKPRRAMAIKLFAATLSKLLLTLNFFLSIYYKV